MRPDVSNITLYDLCVQLFALPEGVECLHLRLVHHGASAGAFVVRGEAARVLTAAMDAHQNLIGRTDFDGPAADRHGPDYAARRARLLGDDELCLLDRTDGVFQAVVRLYLAGRLDFEGMLRTGVLDLAAARRAMRRKMAELMEQQAPRAEDWEL